MHKFARGHGIKITNDSVHEKGAIPLQIFTIKYWMHKASELHTAGKRANQIRMRHMNRVLKKLNKKLRDSTTNSFDHAKIKKIKDSIMESTNKEHVRLSMNLDEHEHQFGYSKFNAINTKLGRTSFMTSVDTKISRLSGLPDAAGAG